MKHYRLRYLYLSQQWQWSEFVGDEWYSFTPFMDVDDWLATTYWDDSEVVWS